MSFLGLAGPAAADQPEAGAHHLRAHPDRAPAHAAVRAARAAPVARSQDRIADTSGLAGETLNAIQTVQAFTLEELQGGVTTARSSRAFATAVRRTRVRAWLIAAPS